MMLWRAIDQTNLWGKNIFANMHASIALGCDNKSCPDREHCWAHDYMHNRFKHICDRCGRGEVHEHFERKIKCRLGWRVAYSWIGDIACPGRDDIPLMRLISYANANIIVPHMGRVLIQTRYPSRFIRMLADVYWGSSIWPGFEVGTTLSDLSGRTLDRLYQLGKTGPIELIRFLSIEPVERLLPIVTPNFKTAREINVLAAIAASRARWVYIGFSKNYKPTDNERTEARWLGNRLECYGIKVIYKINVDPKLHEESKHVILP